MPQGARHDQDEGMAKEQYTTDLIVRKNSLYLIMFKYDT